MRRVLVLFGVFCGSLVVGMPAWAQFGGGGEGGGGRFFGQPAAPKPIADPRPIQLEIMILDVPATEAPAKPLTEEQQLARLERLESENKLAGLQRLKLNLIAEQPSQLQIGESVQVTVGRTRAPGPPGSEPGSRGGFGAMNEMTRVQDVGTLVQATARPVPSGAVVEIKLERSGLTAPRPAAPDAAVTESPKRTQMTVSTTLLIKEGQNTVVASSLTNQAEKPREETWVIARVTVATPEKPAAAAKISIYYLRNVSAKDAAAMIGSIFDRGDVRAIADVRTNTMIVASAPEDILQQIEAILNKLDESGAVPAAPQVRKLVPDSDDAPVFNATPARRTPPARDPVDDLFDPKDPKPIERKIN